VRNAMSDMQGDQSESPLAISLPMPALRLNQRDVELDELMQDGLSQDQEPSSRLHMKQPAGTRWIRLLRGVIGILLLALTWLGLVIVVLLVRAATHDEPLRLWPLGIQSLMPLLELIGAVWLGVAVAMSLLVGAFLLWLALSVRGW
jgi:hypothetical protein